MGQKRNDVVTVEVPRGPKKKLKITKIESGLAGLGSRLAAMAEPERATPSEHRSSPTSSPSGGRSSSACARPGSSRSRTSSPGARTIAEVRAAHEGLAAGMRPSRATGSPAGSSPGAATARPPSSTSATAAARSSSTLARTCSARRRSTLLVDLDLGDIVGIEGTAFATRRGGELSLAVDHWRLLAKSLRPPPDKFHGLEDTETRFRRRELDLIANEESRRALRAAAPARSARSAAGSTSDGFVEVETPVLQPLYGGALARPFTTHHNALDRDLYLRIATELYLKRLVVGGIDRVYELGKDFRNEGISHKHNPEFTMLEWYEAYADYEKTAHDLELLVAEVAERVLGTTKVERGEAEIDLAPPWRRITMREAILERAGIDIADHPTREALAAAMGTEPDPAEGWGKLVDGLLSSEVEPALVRADLRLRLPGRALAVRQGPPLRATGWSSAGRPSPAGSRSPTPSASSTTPTSSAAASSSRPRSTIAATRRPSPTTRPSSRRSNRGCRRPAASASASTVW